MGVCFAFCGDEVLPRHTLVSIDSTFYTPRIYILASGGPSEAHNWS